MDTRALATLTAVFCTMCVACSRPSLPSAGRVDAGDGGPETSTDLAVASPGSDASETPLLKIVSFDCEKHPPLPGQPEASGLVRTETGLRGWHGGGPEGAAWNVFDVRCTTRIVTRCTAGKLFLTARVGRSVVLEREIPVRGTKPVDSDFLIPEATWMRNTDDDSRRGKRQPFRTAIFRLLAEVNCTIPIRVTPGTWRFIDRSAHDSFPAGFASGE